MTKDEKYMSRCLELAPNGLCTTAPNPMVGAVIVYQDRIIGEGYHIHCGQAHAEVNAIQSVKDSRLLKDATIYVSLEPCSHYGKTPPCADLIIKMGIPRVVIGCMDPFSLVAGRGIRKLRDAGIEVRTGVLEKECQALICRFTTFHEKKRPYILLKWAESVDGFIASNLIMRRTYISTELTQMLVHKLRSEYAAILVGRRTALVDNPSLTTRAWYGKTPVRIVIDKDLTLPSQLHLFDGAVPTIVFTSKNEESPYRNVTFKQLDFSKNILPSLLHVLYEEKLQSLIVEGGRMLLQSFIDAELWDEAYIEKGSMRITDGVKAPRIPETYKNECDTYFGRTVLHYHHKCSQNL